MSLPTVSFFTTCWEKDWRVILLDPDYLRLRQIGNHCFPFSEKILVINNVDDLAAVKKAAQEKVDEGVLTRYVVADEAILPAFQLNRAEFPSDWLYYNAIGPLTAIHGCQSDYLLYLTGDVRLDASLDWIRPSLRWMEKDPKIKVANPTWNGKYKDAKKESYRTTWNFYQAKEGFSDQVFLVRTKDFRQPIYWEIRPDGTHYPHGDTFEKRVFSYMKNREWERITFRRGSYIHENI
jgi:hypothetical protein